MIRIGMVGVGGFAAVWRRVLAPLHDLGVARIVAVAERDQLGQADVLQSLRAQGCAVYASLDEILATDADNIDLIGLPVGIPWHYQLIRLALLAGKNVLVEKPLTATAGQARELIALANERGLVLDVAYQFMYSPTIRELARRIQSGELGRVLSAASVTGWPRPASYYARNAWAGRIMLGDLPVLDGPATNAAAHHLMNLLYLAGRTPGSDELAKIENVQAELYRAKPIDSYDTSSIRARLVNGAEILHNVSHALTETIEPVIDMRLERATVHWDAPTDTATISWDEGRSETIANPAAERIHGLPLRHTVAALGGPKTLAGETYRCPADVAVQQVVAINLAFASSGRVHTIPANVLRTHTRPDDDALVAVEGMEQLLLSAHDEQALISELGAPWAVSTPTVRLDSLDAFTIDDFARLVP